VTTWSTACLDWRERIVERRSLLPSPLFANEAEEALAVFKSLKIVDAPGQPTFGEACEPWVFEFVAAVFGAYDAGTARRLIREFFLLISKKNAKSTIAAGIMVTALIRNWRHSAELLLLAPTLEVANNAFGPARDMVHADDELTALLHVQEHTRTITHRVTKAVLKVVAADSDTVAGIKAGFVLVDELWLFGKRLRAGAMLREATGGLISKPEGFVIYLSTQSDEKPAGVFKSKLAYARKVRDGVIVDPTFLPVLFEFPAEMIKSKAYLDPANFYVTNPNIGRSVDAQWLSEELGKVVDATDGELQVFLSKHLNIEIDLSLSADRWAGADYWTDAVDRTLTLETLIARSSVITAGVDGGGLDDLFALGLLGKDKETGKLLAWCRAWAHTHVLDRRKDISERLLDFANDGDLIIVEDGTQPAVEAADIIAQVRDASLLPEKGGVGVDPYAILDLIDALEARDIRDEQIYGVKQGSALSPATWGMEIKLQKKTLLHADQPLMTWCVGNAKAEQRGNAQLITKQMAGKAKIDPLVALFNATLLMSRNPTAPRKKKPKIL